MAHTPKAASSRKPKAPRAKSRTSPPASNMYEDGKKVTGLPTIFERSTASEKMALRRLRTLKLKSTSPAQAWKTLNALQVMLADKKR